MKDRKLRTRWSIGWSILCLLVIVFWVRSYREMDSAWLRILPSWHVYARAGDGRMIIRVEQGQVNRWFGWESDPITFATPPDDPDRMPWFDLNFWPTFARLYTAHWLLAVICGSFAALPWCPRRYNVRGLLIATTVVAAIIGLIVWVDRSF